MLTARLLIEDQQMEPKQKNPLLGGFCWLPLLGSNQSDRLRMPLAFFRREFACPLDTGIPQAEPQSSHLFALRASRLSGNETGGGKKPTEKPEAIASGFSLAPPAGLEPATT